MAVKTFCDFCNNDITGQYPVRGRCECIIDINLGYWNSKALYENLILCYECRDKLQYEVDNLKKYIDNKIYKG